MKNKLNKRVSNQQKNAILDVISEYPDGGKVLDLGAGDGVLSNLFNNKWEYVGIDIDPASSDVIQADAHELPFDSNEFNIIVSIAVFEHLHSPWIAIKEVNRVLKPKGHFVGTVAFLEPEHGNSYFHMSRRGMTKILEVGNFENISVVPVIGWNVINSMRILPIPGGRFYSSVRSKILFSLRKMLINLRLFFSSGEKRDRILDYKRRDYYRYVGAFLFQAKKR